MRNWASQDSWTMRHEARFIKFAWKFGTQNLVATCTLTLRKHLEYFPKSILGKLYIASKLWKSRTQCFKCCANQNWNGEVMCAWSSKLVIEESWVRNGFRPFKTQRNARKLLEEAKFESNYLFQVRGIHFKLENIEFLHGQWVSSKFLMNFKLMMLIFELRFFLPLMSSKLISNLPKFQTQPPVIEFEPQDMLKWVQRPPSNSKHFVLN